MKECTFKPRTNKTIQSDISPKIDTIVKGIDSVKRRRDLIEKRKQEKLEREKEVFDWGSKYDSNPAHQSYTIPEPFNLSKVVLSNSDPRQIYETTRGPFSGPVQAEDELRGAEEESRSVFAAH